MTDANRPRFVDNLPAALIAIGLTGLACYSTIKSLFLPQAIRGSILLLQLPGASSRSVIVINILLEIIFAALIFGVAVSVRRWERVLVFFYSALIFSTQAMYLLPGAITAIRWIKVTCALVSLVAALALLIQLARTKRSKTMVQE
jgi:hypothetical protein